MDRYRNTGVVPSGALSANEYKLCLHGHSRGQDNIQVRMLGSEATLPGQIGTVAIYPPCPSSRSLISFVSRLNTTSSLHSTWLLSKPAPPNANTSSFLSTVGHCSGKPLTADYALLLWHTVLAVRQASMRSLTSHNWHREIKMTVSRGQEPIGVGLECSKD